MPTIVHTMLVRVGSTVCWGKVGSADDGATTSGWGGSSTRAGCSQEVRRPQPDGCALAPRTRNPND
jgi:hypothetical protein